MEILEISLKGDLIKILHIVYIYEGVKYKSSSVAKNEEDVVSRISYLIKNPT